MFSAPKEGWLGKYEYGWMKIQMHSRDQAVSNQNISDHILCPKAEKRYLNLPNAKLFWARLPCISQVYILTVYFSKKCENVQICKAFWGGLVLSVWRTLILTWQPSLKFSLSDLPTYKVTGLLNWKVSTWSHIAQFTHYIWVLYGGRMCNKMCEVWSETEPAPLSPHPAWATFNPPLIHTKPHTLQWTPQAL